MAKYKHYDYSQTVLLPVSLQEQLMPGTLEFAIHELVEHRMDMSRFEERFKNDETGRTAYNPKVVLKVVLLAYARGITGSRKIEQACRENVVFMALSCWQHPDHSTIAAFVSRMKAEIVPLFRDVLLVCEELKLLGGTEFSLDGCRLPSNASKRWSGTIAELQQKKEKLESKVKQMLTEQVEADKKDESGQTAKARRDQQVKKLKKQAERIGKFLEENEAKPGRQYKEIKSNITDNESAMMHTSHGTMQGYNAQALVDAKHQVIVHGDAFGYGQDHTHIPPVFDGAKETMAALGHGKDYFEGATFTADTSYHSTINIKRCEEEKLDAYIPDRYFRARDPRFARQKSDGLKKKKKFALEDFHYDETADQYSCPEGEVLKSKGKRTKRGGTLCRKYAAEKEVCIRCAQRERCLKDKRAKRKWLAVPIGTESRNYSQEMAAKIDTEQGRKIYPRRIAIVEPVFANIRTQKRLDRFTLRGKIKVTIQWLLYCMVHNIEKIANYGNAFAEG